MQISTEEGSDTDRQGKRDTDDDDEGGDDEGEDGVSSYNIDTRAAPAGVQR